MAETILEVKDLVTSFKTERGTVKAVDGVSLRLYDEKYLASYEGEILFRGRNLFHLSDKEMQSIRGREIAMVF